MFKLEIWYKIDGKLDFALKLTWWSVKCSFMLITLAQLVSPSHVSMDVGWCLKSLVQLWFQTDSHLFRCWFQQELSKKLHYCITWSYLMYFISAVYWNSFGFYDPVVILLKFLNSVNTWFFYTSVKYACRKCFSVISKNLVKWVQFSNLNS